jgi:hypothetical protein
MSTPELDPITPEVAARLLATWQAYHTLAGSQLWQDNAACQHREDRERLAWLDQECLAAFDAVQADLAYLQAMLARLNRFVSRRPSLTDTAKIYIERHGRHWPTDTPLDQRLEKA